MGFLRGLSSKKKQQDQEHITQVVVDYILAPWDHNLLMMLETRREELLSDAADKALDKLQKEARGDRKLTLLLQERRGLLNRCQVEAVDLAFAYYMRLNNPEELDPRLLNRLEDGEASRHKLLKTRPELALAAAYNHMQQASRYLESAEGEANVLLKAAQCYENALDLLEPQDYPEEWGDACFQLAIIYLKELPAALPGERGIIRWVSIDRAITFLMTALLGWTRHAFPDKWAMAQLHLGLAFSNRLKGDPWENIENALEHLNNAAEVIKPNADPQDWWLLCASLGYAYKERAGEDQAQNLEQSIAYLQKALAVCIGAAFQGQRGTTQFYLGQAFMNRIKGDHAANIEQSIHYLLLAEKTCTFDSDPALWRNIHTRLGEAYAQRAGRSLDENLRLAAAAFKQALQGQALEDAPEAQFPVYRGLGDLYFARRDWGEAWAAYQSAISARDLLYQAGGTTESRQAWLRGQYDLNASAAYCLARLERFAEAVVLMESGEARALSEALAQADVALDLASQADRAAFTAARQRIAALEAQGRASFAALPEFDFPFEDLDHLDVETARKFIAQANQENGSLEDPSPSELALESQLHTARRELDEVTARIQRYAPAFTQASLTFAEITRVAARLACPLVYLLVTGAGGLALIVPPGARVLSQRTCVWLDPFTSQELSRILHFQRQGEPYYFGAVSGSESIATLPRVLDKIWPVLENQLMAPLARRLVELGYRAGVLVADAFLNLFPLPAVSLDQMTFSWAPSARTLRLALKNAGLRGGRPPLLLGIGNPLPNPQPLAFAQPEIEGIGQLFKPGARRLLFGRQATRPAVARELPQATHLHFSCHGRWNAVSALDYCLSLSGDEVLTLRDLLDGSLDLSAARLAVLSACQTGLTDLLRVPGEFFGLPGGFLQAGVPAVVGSLWPVNDLSTALLMVKFYEFHLGGNAGAGEGPLPPAQALRKAQLWLRYVTSDELATLFDAYRRSTTSPHLAAAAEEQFKIYVQRDPAERPFAHPYYWAAFAFYGV